MPHSVHCIDTIEDFEKLKDAWDNLSGGTPSYQPYLTHDWFKLWLEHFNAHIKLLVLVVKRDTVTRAIFPFLLKSETFKGIQIQKIELMGNVYSPVRNVIYAQMDDDEKSDILATVLRFLKESSKWDMIDLFPLPEENFDFSALEKSTDTMGFKWERYFCFGNWYLEDIDFTGDQYIQSRTSNIRKNVKRYGRKLQTMGDLQFKMITEAPPAGLDELMDSYYTVYNKSWKESEMDPTFHRDLAKLSCDRGWLRLAFLFLDDTPIAAQFWIVSNRVAYIVKLAYDEEYKKLIPGVILSTEIMKYVIDIDKVQEVDYLIGDEPYKKDWTPKRRERDGVRIFNNNCKGRLLSFLMLSVASFVRKHSYLLKLKKKVTSLINSGS